MREEPRRKSAPAPADEPYDPPQVEKVMGPDELTREVHYAGAVTVSE